MEIKTQFKEQMIEKCQKRTRNFFIRIICVAFLTVVFLSYFALPVSKVKSGKIEGNYYLTRNEILETIGVNEKSFLFEINKKYADEYLTNHPLIEKVDISNSFFHLNIKINEISPSVKDFENNVYLKDGSLLDLSKFENVITDEMIDKLPCILQSNGSYYSSFTNTRYLLYELSLIFVALFNVDIDFVDFKKENSTDFFAFYLNLDEKYDDIFNGEKGYIEFLFDASCIANRYKEDNLIKLIEKFNLKLSTFFDDFDASEYVNNKLVIKDNEFKTKKIYVYSKLNENNDIEITHIKEVESEV